MKSSKVSIIVPVYNAGRYIAACIESVLGQSWQDWELLLIDDGSTDDSRSICSRYAENDVRIKAIRQENAGVSETRNRGLELATGTYTMFMDADDYWLDRQAVERLVEEAECHRLDIVRGEYEAVDTSGREVYRRTVDNRYDGQCIEASVFIREVLCDEFFLWLFLFRTEAIRGLRFEKGRVFLEDMQFLSTLCLRPLRCMYLPQFRFYAYRQTGTSVSARVDPRKLADSFAMCDFFHALSARTHDRALKRYFQQKSIVIYGATLETLALEAYYPSRKMYIDRFRLKQRRASLVLWMKEYGRWLGHPVYYLSPAGGIAFFRWRHRLARWKRCLLTGRINQKI